MKTWKIDNIIIQVICEQYYCVPGDDDEHAGGHVDGEHVVGELPPQRELHQQAAVVTCSRGLQSAVVLCSAPSVPQLVFTITEKAPTYDFCVGVPISCLLTVGSTPV